MPKHFPAGNAPRNEHSATLSATFAGQVSPAPWPSEDRTHVLPASAHLVRPYTQYPHRYPAHGEPVRHGQPSHPAGYAPFCPSGVGAFTSPPVRGGARRQISLRMFTVGAAAVVGLGVVAAVAVSGVGGGHSGADAPTASGTDAPGSLPSAAAPAVGTADLEGLLLDGATLGGELGLSSELRTLPAGPTTMYTDTVDKSECIATIVPASREAYAGSGWVAVRKNLYAEQATGQTVGQAVVSFPTAERAAAFVAAQTEAWRSCEGQTVTLDPTGDPAPIEVTSIGTEGAALTATAMPQSARDKGCDRALRAEANVVVDVQHCGLQPSQSAAAVAAAIAEQFPSL